MNKVWNQWVDPQNKVDFFLEVRGTCLWSGMHLLSKYWFNWLIPPLHPPDLWNQVCCPILRFSPKSYFLNENTWKLFYHFECILGCSILRRVSPGQTPVSCGGSSYSSSLVPSGYHVVMHSVQCSQWHSYRGWGCTWPHPLPHQKSMWYSRLWVSYAFFDVNYQGLYPLVKVKTLVT